MTTAGKQHIRRIAKEIRLWGENFSKRHNRFDGVDLEGMCGICSYMLWRRFERCGIQSSVAQGSNHAFVIVGAYLVDVTATQFPEISSKVILRQIKRVPEKYCFWQARSQANTDKAMEAFFATWDESENPFEYNEVMEAAR